MKMSAYLKAREQAERIARDVEALQTDENWQATLADIRSRFPNGVMHP